MKEIDRRGRTIMRLIMWGVWLIMNAIILVAILTSEPVTDQGLLYYGIVQIALLNVGFMVAMYFVHRTNPRVYVSEEGIYHKPFFRKHFTPWSEISQAMILQLTWKKDRPWRFFLMKKTATYWYRNDTTRDFLRRNKGKYLYIPLVDESREYVKKRGIQLVRDESKGRRIPWTLDR